MASKNASVSFGYISKIQQPILKMLLGGLERLTHNQEIAGSNPAFATGFVM